MQPSGPATSAPAKTGNGRHEDLRLASQSWSSANSENDQHLWRFNFVAVVSETLARVAVVVVAAATCEDIATLECGLRQARAFLIEAILTFRETAHLGEEDSP